MTGIPLLPFFQGKPVVKAGFEMTAVAKGFVERGAATAEGDPIALFIQDTFGTVNRNAALHP